MSKVKLGDVVIRIKDFVDKDNTDLIYYVGGEHFDSRSLTVNRKGIIAGSTIGPAFSTKFKAGDVLLMSRNPHLRKAGIVDFDGICSDVSYIIRTKDESVLMQRFIPLLFQSDAFWQFAEKNKKGSTNFFLNWSDFERFEFELPSRNEQEKICKLLWINYDVIDSYKKIINQTKKIIEARFVDMFGNLGDDPYNYGIIKFKDCIEINPKKPKDIRDDVLVTFVPMTSVTENGEIDCSISKPFKEVKKGFTYFENADVLFAKITPCMENGKGCISEHLMNNMGFGSTEFHVLRPIKNVSNEYWIYTITMFDSFRKLARKNMTGTGGQLRVPLNFIEDFDVALPPIKLQDEFASFFKSCKAYIENINSRLDKAILLYNKLSKKVIKED